ncbi:MAG: TonB-dependent receptor [Elusimicrobia bacterium]|nr:TonB-dependent receptor [Elusimicrobiota bacterium]
MKRKIFVWTAGMMIFGRTLCAADYLGNLGTVVVTEQKPIWQIPTYVEVITQQQIENSNADSITDIIRQKSGISVSDWMGNSAKTNVDITGFGETAPSNVLVLLNGKRLNEMDMSGVDWLQIPMESVERIEIIKGGKSALYGDNAGGGVINIVTGPVETKKIILSSKIGSYNSLKNRISVSNRFGNFSLGVLASADSNEGYRQENSFDRKDISASLGYENGIKIGLSHFYHKDKYEMPGGLWDDQYDADRRQGKQGDDSRTTSGFSTLTVEKNIGNATSRTEISVRSKNLKTFYGVYSYDQRIPMLNFREKIKINSKILNKKNTLIFSAEKFIANFKQDSFTSQTLKRKTSTGKDSIAFSAADELFLTDNLSFSIAARKEKFAFDLETSTPGGAKTSDERSDTLSAFSSGISFKPCENTNFYLSFSRNYRLPNVDEFKTFDPFTYAPTGISKNLTPQKSLEIQIGLRKNFSHASFAAGIYRTSIKNEIFYNSLSGANENYPKTKHQGINFSSKIKPANSLTLLFNYSFTDATLQSDKSFLYYDYSIWNYKTAVYKKGNKIPGVARHKFNVNVELHPAEKLTLTGVVNYTGTRYFISDWKNEAELMPAFITADLNFVLRKFGLKFFAGAKNLFNRKYAEYGIYSARWQGFSFLGYDYYYYPSPERNFSAGISVEF